MIGMKAVRSLVAAVLALVFLAMPRVVLADGRVALPRCLPEQPARTVDAAYGGDPDGQRWQLRRPERGPAGDETLVAYAAAAGTTAADGRGRNIPYTAALLSHLETPLEIGLLFRRVRAQVLAATTGAQRPHEYHSLVGEHYLTRTLATGASTTVSFSRGLVGGGLVLPRRLVSA